MSTIVTRAGKGSQLSWNEVDTNFTNLNTDKIQSSNAGSTGNILTKTAGGAEWAAPAGGGPSIALLRSTVAYATIPNSTTPGSNFVVDNDWSEYSDTGSIVSVSGDTFTLVAGTYIVNFGTVAQIVCSVPSGTTDTGECKFRLHNTTSDAVVTNSTIALSNVTGLVSSGTKQASMGVLNVWVNFTIASSSTFEIRAENDNANGAKKLPEQGMFVNITKVA